MEHADVDATTIGEAFAAGRRLAVRKFWPSLGLLALFTLMCLLPTLWIQIESMGHARGIVLPVLVGSLVIPLFLPGLYRGLWKGMSGGQMGLRDLFWAFGCPSRLGGALTLVVLGLPPQLAQLSLIAAAKAGQPESSLHAARLIVTGWYVIFGAIPLYVVRASARFDLGAGAALRTAFRCFRAGYRRWLALPWVLSLAYAASAVFMALIVGLGLALFAALRASHLLGGAGIVLALLILVALVPLTLAWAAMGMTWFAGACLAAVGDLHGQEEGRGHDGVPDTVPIAMAAQAE